MLKNVLSVISLNIERSKHLDLIVPFLEKQKPDVFCVQELSERDIPVFEKLFSYSAPYVPLSLYLEPEEGISPQGVCIFSNVPITDALVRYYAGDSSRLPETIPGNSATYLTGNRAIIFATFEKEGKKYRIGTTHFTWSEKGRVTDLQRQHLTALQNVLKSEPELILCGDFNLPRGGELFSILANMYTDTIPPEYVTSIDLAIHRNRLDDEGELSRKMVDGLFTTPEYRAQDVRLVSGVSDHMAIVATVEKS